MSDILWLDYESRSEADLRSVGAYNYARHSSTQVLCMAYAFDNEEPRLWWPSEGAPFPSRVVDHFASGRQIRAHNEAFDRLLTWYIICPDFNIPEPKLEQWYCTATQARANCAPGSLEDVGRFSGAGMRKDHRGSYLVRQCCIPPFNDDPEILKELGEYALQDVRAMRSISQALRELSADELRDYHVNERTNLRGVLLDKPLALAAVRYAEAEAVDIQAVVCEITEGQVTSVRSPKMRQWVLDRVGPQAIKLATVHKDGVEKLSIDKTVRLNLLALAEENHDEVPPEVAEVIQCADDLWASSVAKFARAAALADDEDSRVRGAFVFAGGSATGRASSYGLQVQNFPRKCADNPALARDAIVRGHQIVPKFGPRITDVLKGMLRPSIIAPEGKTFVIYDWSSIEARVNPWLSLHQSSQDVLDVFAGGRDIYCREAAAIFHEDELDILREYEETGKSDRRQQGKVAILACGFAGSTGAFAAMGRIYNVIIPETDAIRIVQAWRRTNPWAPHFWSALERAYMAAMRNRGREFSAGRVTYLFDGQHLWYALPSGRVLCYPFARFDDEGNLTYAKASWKPAADAKEWPRGRLWKGLACENVVQATAHDVLRHALRRLDEKGFQTIAHIHDEIIVECAEDEAQDVARAVRQIMVEAPAWGQGLPLAVDGKIRNRFGK
jgi:DNA polymerase